MSYNRILGIWALIFVFSFCAVPVWALDESEADLYPSSTVAPPPKEERQKKQSEIGKTKFTGFVDVQLGYDNNVDLNSERHKDGFVQKIGNLDLTYTPSDETILSVGVDTFEMVYFNYNINNLLDIAPYISFDFEFASNWVLRNQVVFDYFWYPNNSTNTFLGLEGSTYLRNYITGDLYHELGYVYQHRWYPQRKVTLNSATAGSDDRADDRHRVKYNVAYYSEKFMIKLSNEVLWNESNDVFQSYYDYWAYRVKPSAMYFFTDKFYADASVIFKRTNYNDRRSTEAAGTTVVDNTYIFNTALYYDVSDNITLSTTYSYTENLSNDPFQKYSGSVITGGIYYSF